MSSSLMIKDPANRSGIANDWAVDAYYLDIEENAVAYFVNLNEYGCAIVVAGVVASEKYQKRDMTFVDVEPIKEPEFRSKVREALDYDGKILFW